MDDRYELITSVGIFGAAAIGLAAYALDYRLNRNQKVAVDRPGDLKGLAASRADCLKQRPLVLWIAPLALLGKGASALLLTSLLWERVSHFGAKTFVTPALFLGAALWLWKQPRWARWIVGLFFLFAAIRGVAVAVKYPNVSTYLMIRRPLSDCFAVWMAYALLASKPVRDFVAER